MAERYIDLGQKRFLRTLSTTGGQKGDEKAPSFPTLGRWSSEDHWDERTKEYDAEISAEVAEKHKVEVIDGRATREDERLQIAGVMKQVVRNALIRDGRTIDFDELDPKEWMALATLFKQIEHTELLVDKMPTERAEVAGDRPYVVQMMSDEQLDEMRSKIGTLVAMTQQSQQDHE